MTLWRLYREAHGPGTDGVGGHYAAGRWHHQGRRVTYFSDSPSLCVLEKLIHLDPDLLPDDLRLGRFEIDVTPARFEDFWQLLPRWTREEGWCQDKGSDWLQSRAH